MLAFSASEELEMKMMNNIAKLGTLAFLTVAMVVPMASVAQTAKQRKAAIAKRVKTKSEWQKAAYAGAGIALLGQLNRDKTASYLGAAGALYSTYRMEEDRKSSNKQKQALAAHYKQDHYVSKGVRYDRKTVRKNGKPYYTFVKHR